MVMDPWCKKDCQTNDVISQPNQPLTLKFEDNFEETSRNPSENQPVDHLPDSAQYLATLEAKLRKLKSDPNVLNQLREKREACMQQLLMSNSCQLEESDFDLDGPVVSGANQISRVLHPERQALNVGEIVELIKHDQLLHQSMQN